MDFGRDEPLFSSLPNFNAEIYSFTPLAGGLTNRNYKLETSQGAMVARIYGERTSELGIDRKQEFDCLTLASNQGLAPDVVGFWPEKNVLITQFIEGKTLTEETAKTPQTLKRIAKSLKKLHQGPSFLGNFCAIQTVEEYYLRAQKENVSFPESIASVFSYIKNTKANARHLPSFPLTLVPCHNDLLSSNFLDDGEKIWILDWEYAGMGHPLFDVANFCVNQNLSIEESEYFLDLYLEDPDNDLPTLRQDLLLMRTLSDLRESFWGFLQKGISELAVDYEAYALFHLNQFFLHKKEKELYKFSTLI